MYKTYTFYQHSLLTKPMSLPSRLVAVCSGFGPLIGSANAPIVTFLALSRIDPATIFAICWKDLCKSVTGRASEKCMKFLAFHTEAKSVRQLLPGDAANTFHQLLPGERLTSEVLGWPHFQGTRFWLNPLTIFPTKNKKVKLDLLRICAEE